MTAAITLRHDGATLANDDVLSAENSTYVTSRFLGLDVVASLRGMTPGASH